MTMTSAQIVGLVIVLIVVVALVLVGVVTMRRRALRERFGPEYDRAVAETDNRSAAEHELRERQHRHAELTLNELRPDVRARYAEQWQAIQSRFVEQPTDAVAEADALVTRLVAERGYPTEDYDEALAHLSVEHGYTLGHYRDAHEIHLANTRGEATTEQLRQALVHYRAIFADILGDTTIPSSTTAGSGTPAGTPSTARPDRTSANGAAVNGTPVTSARDSARR